MNCPYISETNHTPFSATPPGISLYIIPAAPELYRRHGSAVSLPRLIVGTRQCRVLISGYINSDATGFDMISGYSP